MLGFIFGSLCLSLLIVGAVRRRFHGGHGGYGGCGRYGRRWGRRPMNSEGVARAAGEVFKRRLDIDEDQEGIVDHAMTDLRDAIKELAGELKDSRGAIANAFRGETVDEAALSAAFARQDDALGRARRQTVSSFKQIHAVLTPKQREKAADWLGAVETKWM